MKIKFELESRPQCAYIYNDDNSPPPTKKNNEMLKSNDFSLK